MKPRLLIATAVLFALSACKGSKESPLPDDSPKPAETAAEAAADSMYAVSMKGAGPYQVGKEAKVQAVLDAKGEYHCNPEYPYKFKLLDAPDGVTYPDKVAKSIERGEKQSVLSIPFTPTSAGKKEISGTFDFSVCNDKTCKIEKKKLALEVDVPAS